MIVYMAHCKPSGGYYYGKTTKTLVQRKNRHLYDARKVVNGSQFHKAIRKYGESNFDWYVIESPTSLVELNQAEKKWIGMSIKSGHRTYNISLGGDGGARINQCGRVCPDEQKKQIANSLREHYSTRQGTMTGRTGKLCPFFGKNHSEETKAKIAAAHIEVKKPKNSGALNGSARAIFCSTTGEYFQTATDAATKYGADLSSIIKCCKGKVKTVKGLKYEYGEPGVFGWVAI